MRSERLRWQSTRPVIRNMAGWAALWRAAWRRAPPKTYPDANRKGLIATRIIENGGLLYLKRPMSSSGGVLVKIMLIILIVSSLYMYVLDKI